MENFEPVIDVYGRRTIEYIFQAISKFNTNHNRIRLRAYGSNINKGIEIAQILKEEIGATNDPISLDNFTIDDIKIPFIDIPLECTNNKIDRKNSNHRSILDRYLEHIPFINYSTYQLLLDWYFTLHKKLEIKTTKGENLLTINRETDTVTYQINVPWKLIKKEDNKCLGKIAGALHRAGTLWPTAWKEIAKDFSQHDDIILGLDTNILYNCTISEYLLPALSLIEKREYVHTPNWILLAVPATVMYELEESANIRNRQGRLEFEGIMGYRAIQEIIELRNNIDIPGLSLLIVGEADPVLDHKAFLQRINDNIYNLGKTNKEFHGKPSRKSSSGDMAIRNQFKKFLRQLDFHKGIFFLTADKSNSALATAEGLHSIYMAPPHLKNNAFIRSSKLTDKNSNPQNELRMNVPLGSIIYELTLSFKEIAVFVGGKKITLLSDLYGRSLDVWLNKQLRIPRKDLENLTKDYKGKCHLKLAVDLWKKLSARFEYYERATQLKDVFSM